MLRVLRTYLIGLFHIKPHGQLATSVQRNDPCHVSESEAFMFWHSLARSAPDPSGLVGRLLRPVRRLQSRWQGSLGLGDWPLHLAFGPRGAHSHLHAAEWLCTSQQLGASVVIYIYIYYRYHLCLSTPQQDSHST